MTTRNQQPEDRACGPFATAGFTLVELMVVTVISSVILLAGTQFLASFGQRVGEQTAEQRMQDQTTITMDLLERDVARAGLGIPIRLMQSIVASNGRPAAFGANIDCSGGSARIDLDTQAQWVRRFTFRDINNDASGNLDGGVPHASPGDKLADTDELFVGGVGLNYTQTSGKIAPVMPANLVNDSSNGRIFLARSDFSGGGAAFADAAAAFDPRAQVPNEYISVVDGVHGWYNSSNGPNAIQNVAPSSLGFSDVDGISPLWEVTFDGDDLACRPQTQSDGAPMAYFLRGGSGQPPWFLQLAHWYLRDDNVLVRRFCHDPGRAPQDCRDTPVMDGVLDFQVAFEVWRCGDGGPPTWVHWLEGHFFEGAELNAGADYADGFNNLHGLGHRFEAMRSRLHGVRATLLVEWDRTQPSSSVGRVLPPGQTSITIEDRTITGLDPNRRYALVELMMDPANLRNRNRPPLSANATSSFGRVNSQQADLATVNGSRCEGAFQ